MESRITALVKVLTVTTLCIIAPTFSTAAEGQPSPSPAMQSLIDKAQSAIDAAGPAAKDAFEVETIKTILYPLDDPNHIRIVHKATGMQCGVSNDTQIEIKVYHTDSQGQAIDVSCGMTYRSTSHTLYAFKRPGSSIESELDKASLGITLRFKDASLADKSPFDLFEESNRFLSLRDYDTIKNTEARAFSRPSPSPRGFYESVWIGKSGDWYIEQRSSAPGYYNWLVGGLWHAVWRNMMPQTVAAEDSHVRELVDSRQKIEQAKGAPQPPM